MAIFDRLGIKVSCRRWVVRCRNGVEPGRCSNPAENGRLCLRPGISGRNRTGGGRRRTGGRGGVRSACVRWRCTLRCGWSCRRCAGGCSGACRCGCSGSGRCSGAGGRGAPSASGRSGGFARRCSRDSGRSGAGRRATHRHGWPCGQGGADWYDADRWACERSADYARSSAVKTGGRLKH